MADGDFVNIPRGWPSEDNMSKYNQMLYMNLSSALVSTPLDLDGGLCGL